MLFTSLNFNESTVAQAMFSSSSQLYAPIFGTLITELMVAEQRGGSEITKSTLFYTLKVYKTFYTHAQEMHSLTT